MIRKEELIVDFYYKEFFAKGGKITKCPPSNKRPESRRHPWSVFNTGRKKITLREFA